MKIPKTTKLLLSIFIFMITFFSLPVFGNEGLNVEELMSHKEFKEAGLDQLSETQVTSLNIWLNKFIAEKEGNQKKKNLFESIFKPDDTVYEIQAINKNRVEINNHEFEMMEKCPDFKVGTEVIFKKGNASGVCKSATIKSVKTDEECDVWCDEE